MPGPAHRQAGGGNPGQEDLGGAMAVWVARDGQGGGGDLPAVGVERVEETYLMSVHKERRGWLRATGTMKYV